ncbi:MAG: VWA domain-containing protein [Actinomycetota bacterium]
MTFASPQFLWALLLVPLALAVYVVTDRRRAGAAHRFTSRAMMPNLVPASPRWRRYVPAALLGAALISLLVAIARPQAAMSVPRNRATVVLAIDASRSMDATDVEPSRLTAARRAATGFLERVPERFQIGIVSFADSPQVLSRPTLDRVALRNALASLQARRGTAIGDALEVALEMRRSEPGERAQRIPMVIVLLSDGNNTTGEVDPLVAAAAARRAGVRVHTILLGRTAASPAVPGAPRPPNRDVLRALAQRTGGTFSSAPDRADLEETYRDLGSSISHVRERREVTVAFVGAALVLLVASGGFSALWFNRLV